jgi:hypothetical protein
MSEYSENVLCSAEVLSFTGRELSALTGSLAEVSRQLDELFSRDTGHRIKLAIIRIGAREFEIYGFDSVADSVW